MSSVPPVFFKTLVIPGTEPLKLFDICTAAEKSLDDNERVAGAQIIRDLCRIYPETKEGRAKLLIRGININGCHITLASENPFKVVNHEKKELIKLYVSDIPISYSNDEIEKGLRAQGYLFKNKIEMERIRGPDGKLTNWITGRRFVWIERPKKNHDKRVKFGLFIGSVWYNGMVTERRCHGCGSEGHLMRNCPKSNESGRNEGRRDGGGRESPKEIPQVREDPTVVEAVVGMNSGEENNADVLRSSNPNEDKRVGKEDKESEEENETTNKREDKNGEEEIESAEKEKETDESWEMVLRKKKTRRLKQCSKNNSKEQQESSSDTEGECGENVVDKQMKVKESINETERGRTTEKNARTPRISPFLRRARTLSGKRPAGALTGESPAQKSRTKY